MFLEKVRETISEYKLLEKGDSVICAVSGGADSVCLLHTMLELRDEYGINIIVANVNHLIRGEESDKDSQFVKELCKKNGLKFYYREYDVKRIAAERKIGEEECGRILRYEFFDEISNEIGNAKIATAHNLNDNAETVLFRLVRGTAAQGFGGILHSRGNIIRPLLDVSRNEIEEYLTKNGIEWCEDSTNKMPIYARNKIRLGVMPLLNEISGNAEEKIVSAARFIAEDNEFLKGCSVVAEKECFIDNSLLIDKFRNVPLPLKRRIVATVFEKWGVNDINAEKIECFIEFTLKDSGKKFDINSRFYSQKSYNKVVLRSRVKESELCENLDFENSVNNDKWRLSVFVTTEQPKRKNNNCAVFDADKISPPFTVTYRKDGDRIKLKGINGTKKLSDIFTDEKVDSEKRNFIPVVRKDDDIIYVGGLRQSSLYAVDKNTDKFFIINYEGRDFDE